MPRIHPSAVVDPRAELAEDVTVGAFAVVEGPVRLDAGCVLHAHAVIRGPTHLGARSAVHPFAVVGGAPQTKRPSSALPRLEAGQDVVYREHVTVHGATEDRPTRIGDGCLLMVGAHVAHDVQLGAGCVLSNGVQLAGHVVVEDAVTFGGLAGVAQYVRIGEGAFVAAMTGCERDVPPFVVVQGNRARVRGVNVVGLRRRGVPEASISALTRAVRALTRKGTTRVEALAQLDAESDPYVVRLVAALR